MRAFVIKDLELPEGKAIKVAKGGPEALRKVLTLLSKRGFTGYIKIESKAGRGTAFLVLRDGSRAMTLYYGPDGFLTGKAALPGFKDLAKDKDTLIEVHTNQTLEPLLESLPKGRGKPSPPGMGAFKRKLEEWKAQGHDVAELEGKMGQSLSKVIKAFAEYKEGMKAREEDEAEGAKLIEEAKFELLTEEPKEEPEVAVPEKATAPKRKKPRARKKSTTRKEAAEKKPAAKEAVEAEAVSRAPTSPDTGMQDRYTFDTFIVGDSNRFAHAACTTISEGSVDPYSPLFLVGGPGLGKTHLLHALARQFEKRNPDAKVTYLTASQFRDEMEKASNGGHLADFRKSLLEKDILLLDNVQDLEGKRKVQEEIFSLFEDFHQKGKPIALAADRRPSEMSGLDSRLISRFESGLVADLQPPNPEIRMGFLRGRLDARGVSIPERVTKYLADRYTFDLRELEGGLNKVLAYSKATNKPVSLSLAKEALGAPPPSTPPQSHASLAFEPIPGHSYLCREERGDSPYRMFAKRIRHVKGLLITRTNPSRVKETHGLEGAEILWLTDKSESSESTVGPVLERLMYKLESFMITGGQGIILLEGVEYLKSNNGFESVLKFVRRLVDEISESDFTFILTVNPATIEMRELKILENELEAYPT